MRNVKDICLITILCLSAEGKRVATNTMVTKYGKPLQMRQINRNLDEIKKLIDSARQKSDQCYVPPVEGSTPRCRICGSENAEPFVSVWGKYHYYECGNCGSVFLYNLPDVKKLYTGHETANGKHLIDDTVFEQRVNMISAPKVQFVLEICEKAKIPVSQWLDVGCGGGEILRCLQTTNIRAFGIDSDEDEIDFATKKGLDVINCYIDIEDDNPKINKLIQESDVISILNVIEHIVEPAPFVKYIIHNMKPGAVLAFEVPRHPSMASFGNMTCNYAVYRHMVSPIHLQIFSDKSLKYLLGDECEIIGRWDFGQGYTDLLNNAMLLSGRQECSLYVDLLNLSNKIQPIIDEAGFADQMLVVAQKATR